MPTHRLRDDLSEDDDHDSGNDDSAHATTKHRVQENRQRLIDDLLWLTLRPRPVNQRGHTHNIAEEEHNKDPVTALAEQTEDLVGIGPLLGIRRRRGQDTEVEVVRAHERKRQTTMLAYIPAMFRRGTA